MRHPSFWASFMKPQYFLTTLAWLALLLYASYVYGTYKQAPPEFRVPTKIHLARPLIKAISLWSNLFENLPRAADSQRTNSSHLNPKKVHLTQNVDLSEYERLLDEHKLFINKLQNRNYTLSDLHTPNQQDASLLHFLHSVLRAPKGSPEQIRAQKALDEEISRRAHVDCVMSEIGKVIFNTDEYYERMMAAPVMGGWVSDDWDCYKTMIYAYETHCGSKTYYSWSYGHAFANMCNAGIQPPRLSEVASQVCANVGEIFPQCEGK